MAQSHYTGSISCDYKVKGQSLGFTSHSTTSSGESVHSLTENRYKKCEYTLKIY